MADALRAARAPFVKWNAQDAGVEDLSKCGLKGSPTVIKRVFAPSARGDKAALVEASEQPAQALIDAIFKHQPSLKRNLPHWSASNLGSFASGMRVAAQLRGSNRSWMKTRRQGRGKRGSGKRNFSARVLRLQDRGPSGRIST